MLKKLKTQSESRKGDARKDSGTIEWLIIAFTTNSFVLQSDFIVVVVSGQASNSCFVFGLVWLYFATN